MNKYYTCCPVTICVASFTLQNDPLPSRCPILNDPITVTFSPLPSRGREEASSNGILKYMCEC